MKKIIALTVVFSVISFTSKAQIHSTPLGGYWNEVITWVGGEIPGPGKDVVIEGPVILASASGYDILTEHCHNLTITSAGTLKNGGYGGGTGVFPLEVTGNVLNEGTVENGPNDFLKILISGNLVNNNIWMPYQTEFISADNHNLTLAPGKTFGSKIINNGASTITALTDLVFTCDFMGEGSYNRDNFYLNGKTLVLGNHSIELRKCLINSGTLTGDFHIKGNFKVDMYPADTMAFIGNITVDDTLTCNPYFGGYAIEKLKITGNITNNGVVSDNDGDNPDDLSLLITGNIINNGAWTCNFVNLIGNGIQYISQSPGKKFDSNFTDLDPTGKVQALSDITIARDFNLNGTSLEMDGFKLTMGGWLYNGYINNTILKNGFLQNITSQDNLTIEGLVTAESGNKFLKSVVVNDTLQSKDYGGGSIVYTIKVDGNIQNNGVIRNIANDDQLSLEITGNIDNRGEWLHGFTKFTGTKVHEISSLAGRIFNGQFYDLDSIGSIRVNNDVVFTGDFNLGRTVMDMQNYAVTFRTDKWLYDGYLKNARLRNVMLWHMRLMGETEINGLVQLDQGNDAIGNITVNDTLAVVAYGGGSLGYTFMVYGNVLNKGLLGQMYDDGLFIKVNGNIINEGVWNAWQNYFLFYSNNSNCSLTITNKGTADLQVNSSQISGAGAADFSILTGGGMQTVPPDQSYGATIHYTPSGNQSNAVLSLDCGQIGSLNTIYLVGFNSESIYAGLDYNTSKKKHFVLDQNFPNPFTNSTTIAWQQPDKANVIIKVYDFTGKEIRTLACSEYSKGEHKVVFDASGLPAGVYFCRLQADGKVETKKMIVTR